MNRLTNLSSLTVLTKLWVYLWPKNLPRAKVRLLGAFMALVLAKISLLCVPIAFKGVIDSLSNTQVIPYILLVLYGGLRFLASLFSEMKDIVFLRIGQRALRALALNLFSHLTRLSLHFHLKRQTGGLSRIIERGTKALETLITFLTFNIIPTCVELLLVGVILLWLYPFYFSFVVLSTIFIYGIYTIKLTEWRIRYVKAMNEADTTAQTRAIDSLLNYETVKYFTRESYEQTYFDECLKNYEEAAIKSKVALATLNIGQVFIIGLGLVMVTWLGSYQVIQGRMTIGDLVAINTFLIQLYIPLFNLGFAYREIKIALLNIGTALEIFQEKEDVKDAEEATPLMIKGGEIRFQSVFFHYEKERPILKDISFVLPSFKTLAIVGESGAGKSTLSRLLFRFYDVTEGSILIDEQDIRSVTQESLRSCIGIVPQDTVLFNNSIYYNIAYGNPKATQLMVESSAKQANIHAFIMSLPKKYETLVGERGLKLSGGEKQRVAIARTLLKDPKILLFDEATSALDTKTEREIQDNLRQISKDRTTLIIAHRLSTIIDADMIIVLHKGEIVERGTHESLLAKKGLYYEMWQKQNKNIGAT